MKVVGDKVGTDADIDCSDKYLYPFLCWVWLHDVECNIQRKVLIWKAHERAQMIECHDWIGVYSHDGVGHLWPLS
jgi:hypothetical protein